MQVPGVLQCPFSSSVFLSDLEHCEPGWDKFQGFCYRHFSQRLSWEVAEQHCRMQGAHLVSIMTPEEQSYINSMFTVPVYRKSDSFACIVSWRLILLPSFSGNYKEYQWTGLNDKTIEDDFRWSDGNPLVRNIQNHEKQIQYSCLLATNVWPPNIHITER